MPRSSSSSSRSSFSSSKYTPNISTRHTPNVVNHTHQVEKPGFFSNMWQGFGLGAGQAIAHNMFRSEPVVKHVNQTSNIEDALPKEFIQCMKENNNDKDYCNKYLEKDK